MVDDYKEDIGEKYELEVLEKLKKVLPESAIVLHNTYFLTDEYINYDLGYKSLQIDIIVIYKGVFVIECKYLSNSSYSKIENCKSKSKEYDGRWCLFKFGQDGKETRVKKSSYGLNQNSSHYDFLKKILDEKFQRVTVKAITVFGGIDKCKMQVKYTESNNYVKHDEDFYDYIINAIDKWYFEKIDEESINSYLKEMEWKDERKKEIHRKQVEYFSK